MTDGNTEGAPPRSDEELRAVWVGELRPMDAPVPLVEPGPAWPGLFAREEGRLRALLGPVARRIDHVGSTSVPGLAAKPIVDIVLEVPDSAHEASYVTPLEAAGYRLVIREPEWFEHRVVKGPDTVNLHVLTEGSPEPERMRRFRDRLRADEADRLLYARTKRDLAARTWRYVQHYADARDAVVRDIGSRAGGGA